MRRNCFDVYRCITKNKFRNLWFEFQVQKFHHTHTVAAIGLFVAQQPGYEAVTFQLQMNFPNRTLTDDSQTLQEAQLLNATIYAQIRLICFKRLK